MDEFFSLISQFFYISKKALINEAYNRKVIFIRSTLCDYLNTEFDYNYCHLGRIFHHDRTTIRNQIRKSQNERKLYLTKGLYKDRFDTYIKIKKLTQVLGLNQLN